VQKHLGAQRRLKAVAFPKHLRAAGSAEALGATWTAEGTHFALYSENAEAVELCLFTADGRNETRVAIEHVTRGVWHVLLRGIEPGQRYGWRVHGPYDPDRGHRFNPHKLLIDPYARRLSGVAQPHDSQFGYRTHSPDLDRAPSFADSAPFVPHALVTPALGPPALVPPALVPPALAGDRFRGGKEFSPIRPRLIYELHVKGFTRLREEMPESLRGKLAALAHPASIAHLKALGVTCVELMPIHAFITEPALAARGLGNYWGYNPLCWLAPDPRYLLHDPLELRTLVRALHDAGLEVVLDLVLNHSAEGDHLGPTLNLRGIDNLSYYRLDPQNRSRYLNWSGCGNSLDFNRPAAVRLALDTLRHYRQNMEVDGFRFDLATTLFRGEQGFSPHTPFAAALAQDPSLQSATFFAEPWDLGPEGYRLGCFPTGWGEWNDRFRKAVRRFWRQDEAMELEFAKRMAGSADFFPARKHSTSINYLTSHDGFTLADLVSYAERHNLDNGEGNRDGNPHEISWNLGEEGPSSDPQRQDLRQRLMRSLLASTLLSCGDVMLRMGDEIGMSQRGNNNAYCQDNALSWPRWSEGDKAGISFIGRLAEVRRRFGHLFSSSHSVRAAGGDAAFFTTQGMPLPESFWHPAQPGETRLRPFGMLLSGRADQQGDGSGEAQPQMPSPLAALAVLFNPTSQPQEFQLPSHLRGSWQLLLDTAQALQSQPAEGHASQASHASRGEERTCQQPSSLSLWQLVEAPPLGAPPLGAPPPVAHRFCRPLRRSSGILLHPTSLMGHGGLGDIGSSARRWLELLAKAGQGVWQVLPLHPPGFGQSPYQALSCFAGDPLLIDPHDLAREGWLDDAALALPSMEHADAATRRAWRLNLLNQAVSLWLERAEPVERQRFQQFCHRQDPVWLHAFACFRLLKNQHQERAWTTWAEPLRKATPELLGALAEEQGSALQALKVQQYFFFRQWNALRRLAADLNIDLFGDLPLLVAHDSADVWSQPELFKLDEAGQPTVVAGVPPDYFSASGQRWGNPLPDWQAMAADGFRWWVDRLAHALQNFDLLRLDHFRGFSAHYEIPAHREDAIQGRWVPGPGRALFDRLLECLGPLPLVAEDLGSIDQPLRDLLSELGFPGMRVLQFAFAEGEEAAYHRPDRYPVHSVAYTGTHDNQTLRGFLTDSADPAARKRMLAWLNAPKGEWHWAAINGLAHSPAALTLFPLQDLLGLGDEARMNLPGSAGNNWQFQVQWSQISPATLRRLAELSQASGRTPGQAPPSASP